MNGNDPEFDTAQTPKIFDGHLARLEKLQKTLTDSILDKYDSVVSNENILI